MTEGEIMVIKEPLVNFQDFEIYVILTTLPLFQIPESAIECIEKTEINKKEKKKENLGTKLLKGKKRKPKLTQSPSQRYSCLFA